MSLCFVVVFQTLSIKNGAAQRSEFPVYDDQRIPRPAGLRQFYRDDIKINPDRIEQYADGFLYGDQETFRKLSNFVLNDSEGRKLWKEEIDYTVKILNQWDFDRSAGFAAERYVKCISQLNDLALVYMLTGQKELGMFIRAHVLQIAGLPYEFWLHAELRGFNPEHPIGGLETSALCSAVSFSLAAVKDIFSSSEKDTIESVLYNKGLKPCLNWLENPRLNNWTAVVSKGAYVAAKYLNDTDGMLKALKAMKYYVNGAFEKDGSYGEGMSYFDYPIRSMLPVILLMNQDERMDVFSASGLNHSAHWRVYPYLYVCGSGSSCDPVIVHFGDSYFRGPTSATANIILGLLYQNPVAVWLMDKFNGQINFWDKLLIYSFTNELPVPVSPAQSGLPLLKTFDNGECYIRSTWEDKGIVFVIRSGDGTRVQFAHQRPELNSINLGAFGEYLIISPGSASYRSPLHYQWDRTTKAANTITIDDKNQLFPGSGKGAWNTTDVSGFWQQGNPRAIVLNSKAGKLADLIVSEAAEAYHLPMKNVRRSVLFVRDPGYFVMIDKIEAVDSQHKYTWRLHLNNIDDLSETKVLSENHWFFSRPSANLDIYLFADQKLQIGIHDGYMHGSARDYSPGGPNEGKPGSSVELEAFNATEKQSVIFYSVLIPTQKGNEALKVKFEDGTIYVGLDKIAFVQGECILNKENEIEKFVLW